MTDELLKEALTAAQYKLPDGHFVILLVGVIPPFGEKVHSVEVSTSAMPEQTKEIIVGLAHSIEKVRGRED